MFLEDEWYWQISHGSNQDRKEDTHTQKRYKLNVSLTWFTWSQKTHTHNLKNWFEEGFQNLKNPTNIRAYENNGMGQKLKVQEVTTNKMNTWMMSPTGEPLITDHKNSQAQCWPMENGAQNWVWSDTSWREGGSLHSGTWFYVLPIKLKVSFSAKQRAFSFSAAVYKSAPTILN